MPYQKSCREQCLSWEANAVAFGTRGTMRTWMLADMRLWNGFGIDCFVVGVSALAHFSTMDFPADSGQLRLWRRTEAMYICEYRS